MTRSPLTSVMNMLEIAFSFRAIKEPRVLELGFYNQLIATGIYCALIAVVLITEDRSQGIQLSAHPSPLVASVCTGICLALYAYRKRIPLYIRWGVLNSLLICLAVVAALTERNTTYTFGFTLMAIIPLAANYGIGWAAIVFATLFVLTGLMQFGFDLSMWLAASAPLSAGLLPLIAIFIMFLYVWHSIYLHARRQHNEVARLNALLVNQQRGLTILHRELEQPLLALESVLASYEHDKGSSEELRHRIDEISNTFANARGILDPSAHPAPRVQTACNLTDLALSVERHQQDLFKGWQTQITVDTRKLATPYYVTDELRLMNFVQSLLRWIYPFADEVKLIALQVDSSDFMTAKSHISVRFSITLEGSHQVIDQLGQEWQLETERDLESAEDHEVFVTDTASTPRRELSLAALRDALHLARELNADHDSENDVPKLHSNNEQSITVEFNIPMKPLAI